MPAGAIFCWHDLARRAPRVGNVPVHLLAVRHITGPPGRPEPAPMGIADRLLAQIWQLEQAGRPTNKSAITEGMTDRTAARRWRTIETLWARGYLYRVWPTVGPSYFRLSEDGKHHLAQLQKAERA